MNSGIFLNQLVERKEKLRSHFPSKVEVERFVDSLFETLFIPDADRGERLKLRFNALEKTLSTLLTRLLENDWEGHRQSTIFFESLPIIYIDLLEDAEAIVAFDPAAQEIEEVLMAYPGFYATAIYRIAHQLHRQGIKILPRLISEYAHGRTGIDIHPGAQIGKSFLIDHGTGIVIGETTLIGNQVKIYQGVTLGAVNVTKANANKKRHPTIGDRVVIYSGATLLGGDTEIGHDSIIGGNVWLTQSVPPYSLVYHKSEIRIRDNNPLPEALNFVI